MDKNKNRTDLLAAGRKKLQQFRQKNSKGNNSKSSGKSGKSGWDASAGADDEAAVTPQNAVDGAIHDTVASDTVATTDELSGKAGIVETATPAGTAHIPIEDSGEDDTKSAQSVNEEVLHKGGSSSFLHEDGKHNVPGTSDPMIPKERFADTSIPLPLTVDFSSQLERQHGEEQVTDVGTMQEVGSSSVYQIDKVGLKQLVEDLSIYSNEFVETAGDYKITDSGNALTEEAKYIATQVSEPNDASLSGFVTNDADEAQERNDHSVGACTLPEPEEVLAVSVEVAGQEREGLSSGSTNEVKTDMLDESRGYGVDNNEDTQASFVVIDAERSLELKIDDTEMSLGCKQVDLSSGLDGSLIKLSQLAEILRILDEEEFRFLFMSRESSLDKYRDTNKMKNAEFIDHESFERLKEQLYVTSFSKDASHLMLSEHQKLIDEISEANASSIEVQRKNEVFAEEIAQCRYELQEVLSQREELQNQLRFSKAEVESFAAKVDELQNKLEMTQGDMSSLSSELFDSRNLVEALQSENEKLNGSLKMISEEKRKLLEENQIIVHENEKFTGELAQCKASLDSLQKDIVVLTENLNLLGDERMRLEEEKDALICENTKLLADLAEYKSTVEALKAENQSSNEIFTSVSEETKKLKEENELVVHQSEKLSEELMGYKDLVVTLQKEISNLNECLMTLTEERNKHEEDKKNILIDYEKQSHELVETRTLEAVLQAECSKAVDDLKEATFRINQLAEENETLKTSLEFHQSKIEDFDQEKYTSLSKEVADRDIVTLQKPKSDCSSLEKLNVYEDSSGFTALERNLKDAGIVLQKLEMAIEGMHLSRSSDNVSPSGVSRLIQAFESKGHTDDHDPEEPPSQNQTTEDPYTMTKMMAKILRELLKELVSDAANASEFYRGELQSKLLADAARTELRSNYDTLREHTDEVEEQNIELMVLYEAIREHIGNAAAKEGELLILCDNLQKQDLVLKSENSRLTEKLNDFHAKISELQGQLDGLYRDSHEMTASISNHVQTLQTEVSDMETVLEGEWNFIVAKVLETVGELDSTVQTFYSDSLAGTDSHLDVVSRVATSVHGATKVIEGLNGQLETAHRDRQAASDVYNDIHEKCSNMQLESEMALSTLNRLHDELSKLVSRTFGNYSDELENVVVDGKLLDLLHPDVFNTLLDQLRQFFGERLQLESANEQLSSELMNRARETDELEKRCLKSDTLMKLIEDIEQSMSLDGLEINAIEPASRLESLIYLLLQKYKEVDQGLSLTTSLEMELSDLRGQVEQLNVILMQYENENLVFKHSLKSAEEDVVTLNSKVQEKVAELEQSEQRVSSLREKLSIAVTKGKGLIVQRDSLKQSLAEASKELEKYSQELLSRDSRLLDLETKLKVYSEAGERMEALESELSYIRNSATALRESFLLKDSVLQRIEEILEDLELPEQFHSRDIIEKIDWLARSVAGNSLPLADWDQRSSAGGGSYSDPAFVGVDDMPPNSNSGDELRRRFEELQNKFYGLAEQNEMLEQSLMETNSLVQRWEEILDRVDMPHQLRSMEPEDKIQWLESELSEAQNLCNSLQKKIDSLETSCGSLTADVEDSHRRISELEEASQHACAAKEKICRDLEILSHDNNENSKRATDLGIRNGNLQNEVSMLEEQKLQIEEDIYHMDGVIRRLQDLVKDALQESSTEDVVFDQEGVKYVEDILRKLVEKYKSLSSEKPVDIDSIDVHIAEKEELSHISRDCEEQDAVTLSKKLEDCMGELMCLKEEKDTYMQNNQSLLHNLETLEIKNKELQELLKQEEQKSASLREKLNVAVRKGKSLVQQRDGMKQVIEELNAEVERLKSETKRTEKAISEYEDQIKGFLTSQERVQMMESENAYLKDHLAETQRCLQEKEGSWSYILDALDDIDVACSSGYPFEKLKEIGKHLHDLRTRLDFAEQESRKSKRAAELLLAELNEVQERNDGLQDELAKAAHDLSELSREKALAENAKYEAIAHVEKLSYVHAEEKDRRLSEFLALKSGVEQMKEELLEVEREVGDVLSKDVEVLHTVETMVKSFFESGGTPDLVDPFPGGIRSRKSENKVFMTEIGSIRDLLYNHSYLLHEEACRLSEVVRNMNRDYTSHKESSESIKSDIKKLESVVKQKESELHILRGNMSLLYGTCSSAISEMENWKDHEVGNELASRAPQRNTKSGIYIEEGNNMTDTQIYTEEGIRGMSDRLLMVLKDFMSKQSEVVEVGQREMKSTLLNLQKELQEKDIQRERICMELVGQIKEAENNAKNYLHDLQQVSVQLHDLQRQMHLMEEERNVLEQKIKELQDRETNSIDLQQKVNSLTDAVASKEQENEGLMQALDEEEAQMEDLANKIVVLENELQQKNKDLENLEASRAKTLKKLSVTVSKFDELHNLSESLLSEVEKLQSQLQERDGEVSFLRQEVTRCTNDALAVTQMNKKRSSDEIRDLLSWLESLISRVQENDVTSDNTNHEVNEYKEILQKQITGLISELEDLRVVSQNSDMLLQEEKSKVEELTEKELYLKNSLREKESQIVMLQGAADSAEATNSTSEIVEVEQMTNKWAAQGTIAPQVRSLRKTNNDQVAIAIDMDHSGDSLDDDDDDKAHGFKSLTTSKIVPRFTRPVSDMVDGLWMSCDRALMRQPALRLGLIIYWTVLHALLATFVV